MIGWIEWFSISDMFQGMFYCLCVITPCIHLVRILGGPKKGCASKSQLHNLTEVSPRTIAYTCIIVSLILFSTFKHWLLISRPILHCMVKAGPSMVVPLNMGCSTKTLSGCLSPTQMTSGPKKLLRGGTSKSFLQLIMFDIYFSRQIPDLPHATTGTWRRPKMNYTGIKGWIMDPVARSATQSATKEAHNAALTVIHQSMRQPNKDTS